MGDHNRHAACKAGLGQYRGTARADAGNAPPGTFAVSAIAGLDARLDMGDVVLRQVQPGGAAGTPAGTPAPVRIEAAHLPGFHRWLSSLLPSSPPSLGDGTCRGSVLAGLEQARGKLRDVGDFHCAGLVADAMAFVAAGAKG